MSDIGLWQAGVLGVVEGPTEFLPVSSTGHLRIAEGLLGIDVAADPVIGFTAVVQVGAIAAVLLYFRRDVVPLASARGRGLLDREARTHRDHRVAWWIIWPTIPIVVVGLLAKPLIDGPLASSWVVVVSLVLGSVALGAADRVGSGSRGEDDVTLLDAVLVGSSQILALLLPGFSRSGATMSTGLLRGLALTAGAAGGPLVVAAVLSVLILSGVDTS